MGYWLECNSKCRKLPQMSISDMSFNLKAAFFDHGTAAPSTFEDQLCLLLLGFIPFTAVTFNTIITGRRGWTRIVVMGFSICRIPSKTTRNTGSCSSIRCAQPRRGSWWAGWAPRWRDQSCEHKANDKIISYSHFLSSTHSLSLSHTHILPILERLSPQQQIYYLFMSTSEKITLTSSTNISI